MRYEDKYLDRVVPEHKVRPKFMAWLSALLDKVEDVKCLAEQLDTAFDLDTAVGVQLDNIGQLIGVSRLLNFEPVFASTRLSDDDYRIILKARISLNHWDGTIEGIYNLWNDLFAEYKILIIDDQDMTMTLRVDGLGASFESEYISRGYATPKPQGVGINYMFTLSYSLSIYIYSVAISRHSFQHTHYFCQNKGRTGVVSLYFNTLSNRAILYSHKTGALNPSYENIAPQYMSAKCERRITYKHDLELIPRAVTKLLHSGIINITTIEYCVNEG